MCKDCAAYHLMSHDLKGPQILDVILASIMSRLLQAKAQRDEFYKSGI